MGKCATDVLDTRSPEHSHTKLFQGEKYDINTCKGYAL